MRATVERVEELRFADGSPDTAASGIAALESGHLVVQDDATHAAWWGGGAAQEVRVPPAVDGLERFSEAAGTKHLKPDLEAACEVPGGGVLLLGSGSSPARMRGVHVGCDRVAVTADLSAVYAAVAAALEVGLDLLNLEGACVVDDRLRWFQRGCRRPGDPTRLLAVVDADRADTASRALRLALDLGDLRDTPGVAVHT